jgi:CheY-like chemotaxis protein
LVRDLLPEGSSSLETAAHMTNTPPTQLLAALPPLRILLVDDDLHARELLAEVLEMSGARVRSVDSVEAAERILAVYAPDLIVSDVGMPQQSGYDLIRLIRALPRESGGTTPAIACSGYAGPEDRRRLIDAGYQGFVAKPVDVALLLRTIARFGGGRKGPAFSARRRRAGGCRGSLR